MASRSRSSSTERVIYVADSLRLKTTCYWRVSLTLQLSLASIERVSVHWPGRHNFCALLRDRPALVDAAIHRVDVDDHRLFKTRYFVSGNSPNLRRRAPMFSLSHR